jgi:hypothetical protein
MEPGIRADLSFLCSRKVRARTKKYLIKLKLLH